MFDDDNNDISKEKNKPYQDSIHQNEDKTGQPSLHLGMEIHLILLPFLSCRGQQQPLHKV